MNTGQEARNAHMANIGVLSRLTDGGWIARTLESWTWLPSLLREGIAAWVIAFWLAVLLVRTPFFIRDLSGRSSAERDGPLIRKNIDGSIDVAACTLFFTGFLLTVNTVYVLAGVIVLLLAGLTGLVILWRSRAFPGRCPECRSRLRQDAMKCKHCGATIPATDALENHAEPGE
jgi:hypothetical protein